MSIRNLDHVFAAAGFSGGSWDLSVGYDAVFMSAAAAASFAAAGKTVNLSSGSFPAWFMPGRSFKTDSLLNPGPFRVKSRVSNTQIVVYETIADEAGVQAEFDGSADPGIQDVLLKDGNAVLTSDAPLVLVSTGALGGARQLDISALEAEKAGHGDESLEGRPTILSIQNSDVKTNNLTIVSSDTINGNASFVVTSKGDYLLYHVQNGVWRIVILPLPSEALATIKRVHFSSGDWDAGASKDTIKILQIGAPSAGEAGPHELEIYNSYGVTVFNLDLTVPKIVGVDTSVDPATGDITLLKGAKAADFNGVAVIIGSVD